MREILLDLKNKRSNGSLGSIGKIKFQPLSTFLKEALRARNQVNYGVLSLPGHDRCVVAIGDVHGDLLSLLSALFLGGVIDERAEWCGGDKIVVQLGDIFDRHGRSVSEDTAHNEREEIDILQYIHGLNIQARITNGGVVSITGNHEADKFVHQNMPLDKYEGEFHVGGWGGLAMKRRLFEQKSDLARYFAIFKPVVVQINNFLFCHGGIVKNSGMTIAQINETWRKYLLGDIPSLPDTITDVYWNRELSEPDARDSKASATCAKNLNKLFKELNLGENGGIVISHTTQPGGIPLYCKGKVWRIDVALSEAFGRRSSPIEVLKICFNVQEWSGKTIVQIIRGVQGKSLNTMRQTTEVKNFVDGELTWVDKLSKVTKR